MAYSVKYLFKFESSNGTTREIRVLQDGYTGEVIQRPLGRAPVLKKQQNGPVHGTSLEFYAECHVDREFIEFYTSDPKAYRVDLYAGATLLWQGHITPELYSEPDIAPPYDVQVVATDGVGELKLYDYAAQGTVTLRALLSGLLARTGLGTDIYLISSLKAGSRGAGALLDMTINLDYMAGESCYDVLTYMLDTLHATITWWKGAWILTRETNVTFTSGKVRYFNTAGNSALLADSVQTLGSLRANPAWPVGQLSTVIDPAKNRVTVQAPWHVVTGLQNSDMVSDSDWTKAKNARYETDGYVLPININTGTSETAVISQATSMAGLRVPMNLSVKATGATSEISAQVTGAVLGVLLTYKVGNVTYHLVKGDDGVPVWQQGSDIGTYIPLRTRIDFQQQLATWDSSRIEAEELSIDNIPPFLQGTTFPAGTLTVYILGYCAKIYGAYLDVVLPKGYQDILRIDNGARGEGGEVEIAIGRVTADNAYYAAFLQGLLLDSGSLITSFSDANFPGGMDYLAFIARDYALSVALPRAKVTGTVYLESGIAAPPLVFTKGALNYWLQTWSWNLYEDELEIEGLTLPSASLTVESETILESNGSTVSSAGGAGSSSAGSPMGGGVGTNYWEIDGTLNTLVKPKDAYAYVHSKDGLFFTGAALSGTVVPDLYVDTVNNQRVLRSPLPLITGGDQIVIDGTPGGGGGGGGATTLAGLDDTNISNPQVGQILSWSGTKWVNANAPAGSITSVSLAAGATNGTLHLVVNGTAQSDVAVTGLGSMAYKSSLAASDIPDLSGSYLPLSAGSSKPLTNDLYITGGNGRVVLGGVVQYNYSNSMKLLGPLSPDGELSWYDGSGWQTVYHSGNFTPGNYLPVAGATLSSTLALKKDLGYNLADFVTGQHNGPFEVGRSSNTMTVAIGVTDDNYGYIQSKGFGITNEGNLVIQPDFGGLYYSRNLYPIYHSGNANGTDKGQWAATSLALAGGITGATHFEFNGVGSSAGNGGYIDFHYNGSSSDYTSRLIESASGTMTMIANLVMSSGKTIKIGDATISWNSNGYLHIDKPLVTAGDQIVISGTPGGGGGGGATTLAGLDDVAITSVANGQLLQYNGSKWVNVAASSVGGVTSVAGYTGAVTAAQIATALTGAGYKLTDTTYSAGTGVSISASNVISLNSNEYYSATTSRTANTVLAAPNGSNGSAGFRALVAADIPTLTKSKISDFPTNVSAFTNDAGYISSYVNTWRNVYTGGTSRVGTGIDTKAINFAAGSGITISYKAAGTGSGQSGSANYFNVEIGVTANTYQPLDSDLTAIAAISSGTGLLKRRVSGSTVSWSIDTNTYLTGNQTITLSGDVSGSGATSISVSIGEGKVTNAMLAGSIANSKLSNSSITINGSSTSLGGSFSTASITAGTAGQSGASTGVSFSIPYVTMNKYGIVTAYGTHTHTISASDLTTTIGSTTYAPYNSAGYLPLSAGASYPLTGSLFIALGQGIQSSGSSYSMIFQDPSFATYVGQPDSMTIIRTSNNNLYHRKVSTDYVIWDASNSNKSDVDWACSTLTASGNISTSGYVSVGTGGANSYVGSDAATNIFLHNSSGYILVVDGVNVRRGAYAPTATLGTTTYPWAGITATSADFRLTNFTDFHVFRNNSSGSAGITYYPAAQTTNYWNVGADPSTYGDTRNYRFYWYYNGAYVAYLTTTGIFVSTGDQVISSDLTLKENLTPVTYSVSDIAKARAVEFDWKDGRGHSMGSIAQDWLSIAPALVHGEEGNMSLAYGQLALVNTIIEAREIETLKARVAELEAEVKRLRMN